LPAGGIDQNVKYAYPAWVEASKLNMDVMKKYMDKNDDTRLDYESKYAGIANYWKNRQGMIYALTKAKTAKLKGKNEAKFNKWANKKENVAKYGKVVETINRYYSKTNEKARHDNYLMQIFRGSSFATISRSLGRELENYAKATPEEQSKQKAIQEATRLRILEEQAKYEAKREQRRNELKEARRKEKQFEQMLQQEAERIRDEELKRIENEQKFEQV
jgi:hypothetical protein